MVSSVAFFDLAAELRVTARISWRVLQSSLVRVQAGVIDSLLFVFGVA